MADKKATTVDRIREISLNRKARREEQRALREQQKAAAKRHGSTTHSAVRSYIDDFKSRVPELDEKYSLAVPGEQLPKLAVFIRKRPLSRKEEINQYFDVVTCDHASQYIYVHEPKQKVDLTPYVENQRFQFDAVFDESDDNRTVYNSCLRPYVRQALASGQGSLTCFTYGETGSGKTYTMEAMCGMLVDDLARLVSKMAERHGIQISIHVSYYEIYMSKVR